MRLHLLILLVSLTYIFTTCQDKQAPPVQSFVLEPVESHLPEQRERQAQEQAIRTDLPEQTERQAQEQTVSTDFPEQRERQFQSQSQEVQAEAGPGEITPTNIVSPSCKISGCFNELCMHETENFNRTCNYNFREEFNCYKNSNCLLMEDGSCDWERTTTLESCLRKARRTSRREREPLRCVTTGCNNEICIEESRAPMTTPCIYRPEYDCLKHTRCVARGNRCEFDRNRDFLMCLFNISRASRRERESEIDDRTDEEEEEY